MPNWTLPAPPAPTALTSELPENPAPVTVLYQDLGTRGGHWEAGGLYIEYTHCSLTITGGWQYVFGALTDAEGPIQQAIGITTGITNSQTEIETFTQSLTVGASATIAGLGASISGTISEQSSQSYTQTFTTSTQVTQTLQFKPTQQTLVWWWQAAQILEYTYTLYTRVAGEQGQYHAPTTLTLTNLLPVIWLQQYPAYTSS